MRIIISGIALISLAIRVSLGYGQVGSTLMGALQKHKLSTDEGNKLLPGTSG